MSDDLDHLPEPLRREVVQERLWRSMRDDLDKLLKLYVGEAGLSPEAACGALVGAAENIGDYLQKVVPLRPKGPKP